DRSRFAYLEAVARTFVGLSPWLERSEDPVARELAPLAQQTLAVITDPKSPDYLSFSLGHQSLVEAAFMAHAILRAPDLLWRRLDPAVQRRIVAEMEASRRIRPGYNNWLLFSAMVETFLAF